MSDRDEQLSPCKHLDYDEKNYPQCTLRDMGPHYPKVRYWERDRATLPYANAAVFVQFCKRMGRINGIFQCYEKKYLHCWEGEP